MPTYDFKCEDCGKVVGFQLTMEEKEGFEGKCPECGGEMKHVFSPTVFIFVGESCKTGGPCSE